MKIKVSESTGAVLDWLVAKCEGHKVRMYKTWLETENTYWKGKKIDFVSNNDPRIIFAPRFESLADCVLRLAYERIRLEGL